VDRSKLTQFSYASRKEPEYMSYRLVQCLTCDLVYVDRPPHESELARAYHVAEYDSSEEATDAAAAYMRAIAPALARLKRRGSALEIGTGTGVFLEHLARAGFATLVGVEPSRAAIEAAPEHRKGWIREAMFAEEDFAPDTFDLVCCFMTMEHVRDPGAIARASLRLLRPGGAFVRVTHDYRSMVNRVLGKRSPIIDIEHMQLFSHASARYLFESSGYQDVTAKAFVNTYPLSYWLRLTPLPRGIKRPTGALVRKIGLADVKLGFNVGNLITAGYKTLQWPIDRGNCPALLRQ
jgi:2-polyprenyl-3-methyl-5-hydroxy-6-metoxy-1,4-benzoquinol methylase